MALPVLASVWGALGTITVDGVPPLPPCCSWTDRSKWVLGALRGCPGCRMGAHRAATCTSQRASPWSPVSRERQATKTGPAAQDEVTMGGISAFQFVRSMLSSPCCFFLVTGSLSMVKPIGLLSDLWAAFSCLISRNSISIPTLLFQGRQLFPHLLLSFFFKFYFLFSPPVSSSFCFLHSLTPHYTLRLPSLPSINILTKLFKWSCS